jgi:hypothetical protein
VLPPNPTVALGGNADLRLETLDKPFCAHADRVRHRSNIRGERNPVERREREGDRGVYATWSEHRSEGGLNRIELCVRVAPLEDSKGMSPSRVS